MDDDTLHPPFSHLNLRRNPFGQVPLDERPQLAVVDVEKRIQQVQSGTVVEFVGASGRGKSTHLRVMAERMPEAAYVHVHEDRPPPEMPDCAVLCVDEAQFLPPRRRRALYRSDANLALGTHTSLADEVAATGRAVDTVSLDERGTDADLVRQIIQKRLEWARRGDGDVPTLSDDAVAWLLDQYRDNLRAMEHHLYAVFQRLDRVRTITPDDLEQAEAPPDSIVETREPPTRGSMDSLRHRVRSFFRAVRETLPPTS